MKISITAATISLIPFLPSLLVICHLKQIGP
jgi:hypothetical protein